MNHPVTVTALLLPCTLAFTACNGDLAVAENGHDGGSSSGTPLSSSDLDSSPFEAESGGAGLQLGTGGGGGSSGSQEKPEERMAVEGTENPPYRRTRLPTYRPPHRGSPGSPSCVNGVVQTPLACPADSWEYPPPAGQVGNGTGPGGDAGTGPGGDTVCMGGVPCPGPVFLVNTGNYPVAYTAQATLVIAPGTGQPPGVQFGNAGELSGGSTSEVRSRSPPRTQAASWRCWELAPLCGSRRRRILGRRRDHSLAGRCGWERWRERNVRR